jgi:alpha-L-rhamnosidase
MTGSTALSTVRCVDLRCEHLADPIGLDTPAPRLSWRIEAAAGETDIEQQACQVEVAGRWDSGRMEGWRQQLVYGGPTLVSRETMRWRVRVWTTVGATDWSAWTTFETGVLDTTEWVAKMITSEVPTPVIRFAGRLEVPDDVVRARLRVTAHGIYVATINGTEVGDEVLTPGWTSYHHRLAIRTYNVTDLVHPGTVEAAILVGPGWFSGRIGFTDSGPLYGAHRGAFAQLELDRSDGSLMVVGTDESWTASATPYLQAEIYDGETYDARIPSASESGPVSVVPGFDPAVLCTPPVPPVRRTETVAPVAVRGNIFDFGQNLVGWLRVTVRDLAPGSEVRMRHAEILSPDGQLFTEPLRTAKATDRYIAAGTGEEHYEPRFTFHGFRYAEITGTDPAAIDVSAVVVHSDLERTGRFSCSEPLLERLHQNIVWGQRGNFVSIPTDCPQRDERLGWTGDAQVFSPTASFLYDCETFWEGWLADLAADQLPSGSVTHVVPGLPRAGFSGAAGWGDAAVVVPWTTYLAYGDDAVLRAALPSMRAWVDYVSTRLDGEHCWRQDFQFGDWLDPDAPTEQPWRAKARFDLVATAYAARSASLLARAAAVLGEQELAAEAAARAEVLRSAWWAHFAEAAPNTQTGAALAMEFGLAPDAETRAVLGDALASRVQEAGGHLATGFLGTPLLLPALAEAHLDVAYEVLLQRTSPSWLYQVLAGATTIWERWDALRPDGSVPMENLGTGSGGSMVSYNHYAYGAVADWLHTAVAGLRPDPDDPGYHHVLIEPRPGGPLTRAGARLNTRYGATSVVWELADDGLLRVEVELPPNTWATVTLPGQPPVRVGSGNREFSTPMSESESG